MVFTIAAITILMKVKTTKTTAIKTALTMKALTSAISTAGTCTFLKGCEAILIVQFLLLIIT